MNLTAIPNKEFPKAPKGKQFEECELVSVAEYFKGEILTEPVYFNQGLAGTDKKCLIRKPTAEKLEQAFLSLPKGLTFKVYDGWRSVKTQQSLYDKYFSQVRENNPNMNLEQLEEETKKFVSKPSMDRENPSVHNTGGAIDLTLFDKEKDRELDMGTAFDDFTPLAYTYSFEEKTGKREEAVKNNRRLLYYTMINAGFTNLPTEWWHYDYGDNFWSYYTGKPSIFMGTLN